jgi:hypothetical protein
MGKLEIVEPWIHFFLIAILPVVIMFSIYITNYAGIFHNPQLYVYIIALVLFVNIGIPIRALFRGQGKFTDNLPIKGGVK